METADTSVSGAWQDGKLLTWRNTVKSRRMARDFLLPTALKPFYCASRRKYHFMGRKSQEFLRAQLKKGVIPEWGGWGMGEIGDGVKECTCCDEHW